MLIIQELVWKPQFLEKIRRKHGVSPVEVRHVLRQSFKVRRAMKGKVRGEDLYAAYGRTSTGRYLTVGVTSRVLCHQEGGRDPLLRVFMSEEGVEDSVHAGTVLEDAHASS